jgi:predicted transcriptional regulator
MADLKIEKVSRPDILEMTTQVVSAYIKNNNIPTKELPHVIDMVHVCLSNLDQGRNGAESPLKPAVPIKKSITDDYIYCLEDGKKLKMLKRHLRTAFNMTPEEYRLKWHLEPDYPMVAPNYAKRRSEFAKQIGLGQSAKQSAASKRIRRKTALKSTS